MWYRLREEAPANEDTDGDVEAPAFPTARVEHPATPASPVAPAAAPTSDDEPEPTWLCCSITHVMFKDPVFIPETGTTFEREAVEAFWDSAPGEPRDPLTNRVLSSRALFPNWDYRREVQAWLGQHPGRVPEGWETREDPPSIPVLPGRKASRGLGMGGAAGGHAWLDPAALLRAMGGVRVVAFKLVVFGLLVYFFMRQEARSALRVDGDCTPLPVYPHAEWPPLFGRGSVALERPPNATIMAATAHGVPTGNAATSGAPILRLRSTASEADRRDFWAVAGRLIFGYGGMLCALAVFLCPHGDFNQRWWFTFCVVLLSTPPVYSLAMGNMQHLDLSFHAGGVFLQKAFGRGESSGGVLDYDQIRSVTTDSHGIVITGANDCRLKFGLPRMSPIDREWSKSLVSRALLAASRGEGSVVLPGPPLAGGRKFVRRDLVAWLEHLLEQPHLATTGEGLLDEVHHEAPQKMDQPNEADKCAGKAESKGDGGTPGADGSGCRRRH